MINKSKFSKFKKFRNRFNTSNNKWTFKVKEATKETLREVEIKDRSLQKLIPFKTTFKRVNFN